MKVVGIIIGGLIALVALPVLAIGIGIVGWIGDGDGLDIPLNGLDAPAKVVAIVSPKFSIKASDIPSQVEDASVTFHITPKPGGAPIFIGLAPASHITSYLRNTTIAHLESADAAAGGTAQAPSATDVASGNGADVKLVVEPGRRTHVAAPATKRFWTRQADSATGDITLSLADLEGKDVRIVVMRTDGKPGMAVDASMRFHAPILKTVGWWLLGIGLAVGLIGVGLIIWMIVLMGRPKKLPVAPAAAAASEPVPPLPPTPASPASTPPPAVDTSPAPPPPGDDAPSS
ncbi:MAG: hypothetical protein ACR2J9_07860 [Gaiellales bacterium]